MKMNTFSLKGKVENEIDENLSAKMYCKKFTRCNFYSPTFHSIDASVRSEVVKCNSVYFYKRQECSLLLHVVLYMQHTAVVVFLNFLPFFVFLSSRSIVAIECVHSIYDISLFDIYTSGNVFVCDVRIFSLLQTCYKYQSIVRNFSLRCEIHCALTAIWTC